MNPAQYARIENAAYRAGHKIIQDKPAMKTQHNWTDDELLFLCDVMHECSFAEIAKRMGIGRGAVASMVKRMKRDYFTIP